MPSFFALSVTGIDSAGLKSISVSLLHYCSDSWTADLLEICSDPNRGLPIAKAICMLQPDEIRSADDLDYQVLPGRPIIKISRASHSTVDSGRNFVAASMS
nr:hypothetical protein CFP56_09991 [Quercus suber]